MMMSVSSLFSFFSSGALTRSYFALVAIELLINIIIKMPSGHKIYHKKVSFRGIFLDILIGGWLGSVVEEADRARVEV